MAPLTRFLLLDPALVERVRSSRASAKANNRNRRIKQQVRFSNHWGTKNRAPFFVSEMLGAQPAIFDRTLAVRSDHEISRRKSSPPAEGSPRPGGLQLLSDGRCSLMRSNS